MAYRTLKNSINQNIYFSKNDIVKVPRSTFYMKSGKRFDCDLGLLIPIGKPIDVLPGDTFNLTIAAVTKLLSPQVKPNLDTLKQSIYAFFVPYRLVEKDFEQIFTGHVKTTEWNQDITETMSTIKVPKSLFPKYSVADYMGLPANPDAKIVSDPIWLNETVLASYFRGYAMVWDYYFRDENLQEAINIDKSNSVINGAVNLSNDIYDSDNSCINGGNLLPTNKTHDYFTSALPAPQKGESVKLPFADNAEVITDTDLSKIDVSKPEKMVRLFAWEGKENNFQTNWEYYGPSQQWRTIYPLGTTDGTVMGNMPNMIYDTPANFIQWANNGINGQDKNGNRLYGIEPGGSYFVYEGSGQINENFRKPVGLYHNLKVDLSKITAVNINDLRYAFQLQLIKEIDARHGTRFSEYLLGHYGVSIGDARIQQPEFLGMATFELKSTTIAQTSSTNATSPQANLSAFMESGHMKHLFTKSFVEPGFVILLTTIRQAYQIYAKKIHKDWSKKSRWDWYLPELKNIGEQPILNKEIFFDETNESKNDEVFGYQEAWANYRYDANEAMGSCSPYANNNLSIYSLTDKYTSTPSLSSNWIKVNDTALRNTLAIPPANDLKTFLCDIYLINKATRPMPLHSIPGLIDHSGKILI